mmetsp:Transcript_8403/g.52526  ORF Transcript_8403/g.52526 Transcript_8403/m.52526 type:complete len:303 (+) Transcript_8403:2929-3837(+)
MSCNIPARAERRRTSSADGPPAFDWSMASQSSLNASTAFEASPHNADEPPCSGAGAAVVARNCAEDRAMDTHRLAILRASSLSCTSFFAARYTPRIHLPVWASSSESVLPPCRASSICSCVDPTLQKRRPTRPSPTWASGKDRLATATSTSLAAWRQAWKFSRAASCHAPRARDIAQSNMRPSELSSSTPKPAGLLRSLTAANTLSYTCMPCAHIQLTASDSKAACLARAATKESVSHQAPCFSSKSVAPLVPAGISTSVCTASLGCRPARRSSTSQTPCSTSSCAPASDAIKDKAKDAIAL